LAKKKKIKAASAKPQMRNEHLEEGDIQEVLNSHAAELTDEDLGTAASVQGTTT
jgi:hypothetical protein